jgi:VanZ family protein
MTEAFTRVPRAGAAVGEGRAHPAARWLPVVLWAGLIFALSSVPGLDSGLSWDFALRKAAHAAEYAVLGALLARAVTDLPALWLGIAYAVSDELHQGFVPGRAASLFDVGLDSVGVLIGILALRRLER